MWPSLRAELAGLFDLLLPPACPLCRKEAPSLPSGRFCPACAASLTPPASSRCPCCALPYPAPDSSDHLCEGCLRHPPPFVAVAAAGIYDGALQQAVLRFKDAGGADLDRPLAFLLAQALASTLPDFRPDLIVPVPLHPARLRERTYNQALLLARCLGRELRIPVPPRLLVRRHATPSQRGLTADQRRRNLRGAFSLTGPLDGERVLLVDDVMTTGATVRECGRILRAGGAGEIAVAVLGRAARHTL